MANARPRDRTEFITAWSSWDMGGAQGTSDSRSDRGYPQQQVGMTLRMPAAWWLTSWVMYGVGSTRLAVIRRMLGSIRMPMGSSEYTGWTWAAPNSNRAPRRTSWATASTIPGSATIPTPRS